MFGSLRCKRCSNEWLFLITAFLLAGLLLVFLLFASNLTVVDEFIIYVDVGFYPSILNHIWMCFKDKCHYFPGLEFVICWASFAIGSIFLTTAHERLA